MLNPLFIEREPPLPRCPLAGCRRSGRCRFPGEDDPCRRLYEDREAWRYRFHMRLIRMIRKETEGLPPVTHEEGEANIARFYRAVQKRARELAAGPPPPKTPGRKRRRRQLSKVS